MSKGFRAAITKASALHAEADGHGQKDEATSTPDDVHDLARGALVSAFIKQTGISGTAPKDRLSNTEHRAFRKLPGPPIRLITSFRIPVPTKPKSS